MADTEPPKTEEVAAEATTEEVKIELKDETDNKNNDSSTTAEEKTSGTADAKTSGEEPTLDNCDWSTYYDKYCDVNCKVDGHHVHRCKNDVFKHYTEKGKAEGKELGVLNDLNVYNPQEWKNSKSPVMLLFNPNRDVSKEILKTLYTAEHPADKVIPPVPLTIYMVMTNPKAVFEKFFADEIKAKCEVKNPVYTLETIVDKNSMTGEEFTNPGVLQSNASICQHYISRSDFIIHCLTEDDLQAKQKDANVSAVTHRRKVLESLTQNTAEVHSPTRIITMVGSQVWSDPRCVQLKAEDKTGATKGLCCGPPRPLPGDGAALQLLVDLESKDLPYVNWVCIRPGSFATVTGDLAAGYAVTDVAVHKRRQLPTRHSDVAKFVGALVQHKKVFDEYQYRMPCVYSKNSALGDDVKDFDPVNSATHQFKVETSELLKLSLANDISNQTAANMLKEASK